MGLTTAFARFWAHRHRDRWLWFGFALAAAAYYYFRFSKYQDGLTLYRHAAECMWTQQVLQACDIAFTYPPAFAFLMIPFAAIPLWLATPVWYAITLFCMLWCYWFCEDLVERMIPGPWRDREREWFRTLGILISLKFTLAVYEDQAYDFLVLPLTLFGILALADRRNIAAGAALGAAAALKVTPLIFLPYLVFKRRFAAAGIFVIVLAAISLLPDLFLHPQGTGHGYFLTWVNEVAAPGLLENAAAAKKPFWTGANPWNLSLRGAVALAVDGTPYQADFEFWLRLVQLAFIALIGTLFLMSARAQMIPIEGALLIISMLMLSPMTGRGHYVGLLLPYYLIIAAVIRDKKTAWIGITCLVLSFSLSGIPREIVPHAFSEFMKMHSDIIYATLVLIVYFALMIRSPQRWGILPAAPAPDPAR